MGDNSYQILQELRTQGDVLDALNTKFANTNSILTSVLSRLDVMEDIVNVLSLCSVILFGILLFNIVMKWVKK